MESNLRIWWMRRGLNRLKINICLNLLDDLEEQLYYLGVEMFTRLIS